ncbi:chromosome partition protein Smc-like [Panonychus citri]|uniref:chromosome partition protein Smc-like n=1 Tax=Panonychus citri TaxID=50023 RepID=UPI0023071F2D|nr:chromosome partition protein Smc-like [Panonychus citri]
MYAEHQTDEPEDPVYTSLVTSVLKLQNENKNSKESIKRLEDELKKEKRKQEDEKVQFKDIFEEVENLEAEKIKVQEELEKVINDNKSLREVCSGSCQELTDSANEVMVKLKEMVNCSTTMREHLSRINQTLIANGPDKQSIGINTDLSGDDYAGVSVQSDVSACKDSVIEVLTNSNFDLERQIEAITQKTIPSDSMLVLVEEWRELRVKANKLKRTIDSSVNYNM